MPRLLTVFPCASPGDKPLTIGRGPEFDICLYDPRVSREGHAEIVRLDSGEFEVRDLGSTNGTFVNQERLSSPRILKGGDMVRCGDSVLIFDAEDQSGFQTVLAGPTFAEAGDTGRGAEWAEAYRELLAQYAELQKQRDELQGRLRSEQQLVGSLSSGEFARNLAKVAAREVTVLITGERGTGKELVAREIHRSSPRARGPFVAVNCAAIPREMMEGELFGHVKGAFTGATTDRAGRFRAAERGTLFLDEIGDLSLEAQAKLLRAIEAHEIQPVGADTPVTADVRIVAATNKDLREAAQSNAFRADLYDRLRVVELRLPPLRERREDIATLANHFFEHISDEHPVEAKGLSQEAMRLLEGYDWPGNVRELRNAIDRALIFCQEEQVTPEHLPPEIQSTPSSPAAPMQPSGPISLRDVEKQHIENVLAACGGNVREAARRLGIVHQTLYSKMEKHNISAPR